MYIQSFRIDNFGVFSNVNVENLSPGLVIFLGKNEAGKSTCLEFLRTMLTGYPNARTKEAQERNYATLLPGSSGLLGGSLSVDFEDIGLVNIIRRPSKGKDSLVLSDAQGAMLESSMLENFLSGVTRQVYRNVFGFSLSELQVFDSLKDDEVRHALYGASFGMGLRSPGAVLKEFNQKMEKLFKVKGSAPTINQALRSLEKVQKEIRIIKLECAQYDDLSQKYQALEEELKILRANKTLSEQERRDAERQLGVWKQWDEWQTVQSQLSRLDYVPNSFPEDGAGRLERALLLCQEGTRRIHTEQGRCQKLENKLNELVIDENLLTHRLTLQSLSEQKTAFRQAQEGLESHATHLQRAQSQLEQHLADLGPKWTCERIHATNRSLVARSELEKKIANIYSAEQAAASITLHLEKSNGLVVSAQHQVELAQKALDLLPEPLAPIEKHEREELQKQRTNLENAVKGIAEKELSLQSTMQTFQRTLTPLSLSECVGQTFTKDQIKNVLPTLENLRESQDEALDCAAKALEMRQKINVAEQSLAQAQEKEDLSKGRLERLKQHLHNNETSSRTHIDTRAKAIRTLRHMYTNLSLEKERLAEIKYRLQNSTPPAPVKSLLLMVVGFLVILCGLAGLALPMYFDIHELRITQNLVLPLTQIVCYLVLFVGAVALAGGMPRSGSDRKKYTHDMEELAHRGQVLQLELNELEGRIQEQCVLAEITEVDPITLDAKEILLEHEREKCATTERVRLDLEQLEIEHQEASAFLKLKRQEFNVAQQNEQQALLRWHNCLQRHKVQSVPSPESAATFFARVESALVAQAAAQNLEEEMSLLLKQKENSIEKICSITAISIVLSDMQKKHDLLSIDEKIQENPIAVEQINNKLYNNEDIYRAIDMVLESCLEADDAKSERLKADSILHNAQYSLETALKEQSEVQQNLKNNEQDLQKAHVELAHSLQGLGFDEDIAPSMLRSVLECMEKCLSTEADILRMQEEKERMERQCANFVKPLSTILESLQKALPYDLHSDFAYQDDWIQTFDNLLSQAQASYEAHTIKTQLQEQLSTQEEELHEASVAHNDAESTAKHLLKLAHTDNPEEFFRLASIHNQSQELKKRKAVLEDALRLAAKDKDFDEFLHSFASTEQFECEIFLQKKEEELISLGEQEQEKMQEAAKLKASLHGLTKTNTLTLLRQEEHDILENIHEASKTWSKYAVARQLLLQAKQSFERERQPQVIRMASDIFAKITNDKWKGLSSSLEDNDLQVISPFGEPLTPNVLSRGTQEQLYLALRLAYIRNHSAHAHALPVIMDDILVNFDPDRARHTGKALLDLSQSGKKHQIIFFTCHPHMADMLQEMNPQNKKYIVENHTIRPEVF